MAPLEQDYEPARARAWAQASAEARIRLAHDPALPQEHLRRELAAVVLARHRVAVGARVEDRDLGRWISRQEVLPEVVAALADGADDAPGDRCRLTVTVALAVAQRHDAVARLVQRGTQEVVHPRVDHEPAGRARDLRLDRARDEHSVRRHQAPARLDVQGQIVEPELSLGSARRQHEFARCGQRGRRVARVVDPEAPPRVDELERPPASCFPQRADEAEEDARRVDVRRDRLEMRADVRRHSD